MGDKTLLHYLGIIGVNETTFSGLGSTKEEFSAIKAVYIKAALRTHPDKGGNEAEFRALQEAWETIRAAFDAEEVPPSGFASFFSGSGKSTKAKTHYRSKGDSVPSWEWFEQAASEITPSYCVELAKSSRGKCFSQLKKKLHTDDLIAKGSIRCGSMDKESGAYGRWMHLECWRVPSLIWIGLPEPDPGADRSAFRDAIMNMQSIAMVGFAALPEEDQESFIDHLMEKNNWAKATKLSQAAHDELYAEAAAAGEAKGGRGGGGGGGGGSGCGGGGGAAAAQIAGASSSAALVVAGEGPRHFIAPRPGHNGALINALVKKTFVLTGLFPEVGGGTGLNVGKDRLKEIIESFGGRVTSAVSGKTDFLVVGQEPGASKVSKARAGGVKEIDVLGLKTALETPGMALEDAPNPQIESFSAGYYGNALRITDGELKKKPKALKIKAPKAPKEKKPAKKKAATKKRKASEYEDDEDDDDYD